MKTKKNRDEVIEALPREPRLVLKRRPVASLSEKQLSEAAGGHACPTEAPNKTCPGTCGSTCIGHTCVVTCDGYHTCAGWDTCVVEHCRP